MGRQDSGSPTFENMKADGVTEIVQYGRSFPLCSVLMQDTQSGVARVLAMISIVLIICSCYFHDRYQHIA